MFRRKPVAPKTAPLREVQAASVSRMPQWITKLFGLNTAEVPSRLSLPGISPVVETYKPVTRVAAFVAAQTAGAAILVTVPAAEEWELVSAFWNLTTSAAVANREVQVNLIIPHAGADRIYFNARGNFTQVASLTEAYSFSPNGVVGDVASVGNSIQIPAPVGARLPPGARIQVAVTGMDAADVLDSFTLVARVWPANQDLAK